MKRNILLNSLIVTLFLLCIKQGFSQTTYTVTSTAKDGPGSFLEAIDFANNNPGADIIEFTDGLQVDAAHLNFVGNSGTYMVSITESVTIDGKGGALNGSQRWISASGEFNSLDNCPGDVPSTIILSNMPNFMEVGINGQNNSGITVTIKNLSIKQFNSIAAVRDNAALEFENFNADEIWSILNCNAKSLLNASDGASISLKNSQFTNTINWGSEVSATSIGGFGSGDLTIESCLFYNINGGKGKQFLISWGGTNTSEVNIISSRLLGVGGINVFGSLNKTNIVNTTMVTADTGTPGAGDRIINNASGPMNIVASSFKWNSNSCNSPCTISPQILVESRNGLIELKETAIGINFPTTTGTLLAILGGTGTGFTADSKTWIEPTSNQDASALQTITSQPSLITNTPGFKSSVITQVQFNDAELVAPDVSGILIDVINNQLLNPINGNPITTDVLGNARFDANGFRDIGAIQLSLAPILTITGSGDESVDLSWQEPLHHDEKPIVSYEYQYVEVGSSSPIVVNTGLSLSASITGLTNGTTYEFSVRAIYDEGGVEVNGPYGNTDTATPLSLNITVPTVTATQGDEQVSLSWDSPDVGGRIFNSCVVLWKIEGSSSFVGGKVISDLNTTTTLITGLTNGTTYEFSVAVTATNGDRSDYGIDTATPLSLVIPAPIATSTSGDKQVTLSWSPPDLGGRIFNSYVVLWKIDGSSSFMGGEVISDLNTTNTIVTGLTNGTTYEFSVAVTATNGDRSNYGIDTATPLSLVIPTPIVTTTSGDKQVRVSWSPPDLGGRTFNSYTLQWKASGSSNFIGDKVISDINTTITVITGLTNRNTYEFNVAVTATNGDRSDYGISIATLILFYPNPVNDVFYINLLGENINVKLFSINGALLKEVKNKKIIDISNFSTGTYILYIQSENKKYSRKIIKN
jgi:hypothetical protein